MHKKIFLALLFVSFVVCSCKLVKEDKNDQTALEMSTTRPPNVIYILADDLGYGDLSCYGQEKFKTPNIDRLAKRGMIFTQHYAGSTVCAPSRSALMTGMHTGHTIVRGNKEVKPEGQYPLPDSTYTLSEMFKKAGYVTGAFGKWGLGYPGSEGDPNNQGFDVFYGYNCQRLGHNYYPGHLWSNQDSIVIPENSGTDKITYAPDLIHEKTLKFIRDNRSSPFFLYVPSIIPHAELAAPNALIDKYRGKFLPERSYKGVDSGNDFRKGAYGSQKEAHATFAAMIDLLDQQVGEIMKEVELMGIADNTIIIFTSDNGPHTEGGGDPDYFSSNGPFKGTKRDLYEGGIRVPMIASWPGKIEAGSVSDHVSAFWDVLPTFSEITKVEVPSNTDGISFMPEILGQKDIQKKHEYLYWEFHERGGRQAVRKGKWKAVRYGVLKNPNAPIELYDLSKDLGESTNIAEQHPEVVKVMEGIMEDARTPSDIFKFDKNPI